MDIILPAKSKQFDEFVSQFETYNKILTFNSTLQTKNQAEMAGEDDDKREEQLDKVNVNLKEINETLKKVLAGSISNTEKLSKKLDLVSKSEIKPLKDIKGVAPLTLKEQLKTGVASAKSLGSNVVESFGKITSAIKTPSNVVEKTGSAVSSFGKSLIGDIKEIAGTKKDYSVEGERFADIYSKTAEGTKFQKGGKSSMEVGMETFNKLKEKEKEIKQIEKSIESFTNFGFEAPKKEIEKLEKLKQEYNKIDIRNIDKEKTTDKKTVNSSSSVVNNNKKESLDSNSSDVVSSESSKEINSNLVSLIREKNTDTSSVIASDKTNSDTNEVIQKLAQIVTRSENPEADNIISSEEKISDISSESLEVAKKSFTILEGQLSELKTIKDYLAPKEEPQETIKDTTLEPKTEESKGGLLESIGLPDVVGKKDKVLTKSLPSSASSKKPGMGSKILGAAGKAAKFLGPAAAVAGAAYSGFQGFQNVGQNFELEPGKEATTGQKISSTIGGIASGLTFGLADEKSVSQGLYKAGSTVKEGVGKAASAVSEFFGFGGKKDATISPAASTAAGKEINQVTTENQILKESNKTIQPVVVNNTNTVSSNQQTVSPIRTSPRPQNNSFERKQTMVASY